MNRFFVLAIGILWLTGVSGQGVMTADLLWQLGRVSAVGVTDDGNNVVYTVTSTNLDSNNSQTKMYMIPASGGSATEITENPIKDKNISPTGRHALSHQPVKIF